MILGFENCFHYCLLSHHIDWLSTTVGCTSEHSDPCHSSSFKSKAKPYLLVLLFLLAATLMSICQFWWGILCKVYFSLGLVFCIWLKAVWYLHMRDWEIRITSMGLGDRAWCRTIFLWFQIDQRVVKMVCRKHILSCSKSVLDTIHWLSHWSTEVLSISEVLKPRFEQCQIALAQLYSKNRWTHYTCSCHWDTYFPQLIKSRQAIMQQFPNEHKNLQW